MVPLGRTRSGHLSPKCSWFDGLALLIRPLMSKLTSWGPTDLDHQFKSLLQSSLGMTLSGELRKKYEIKFNLTNTTFGSTSC